MSLLEQDIQYTYKAGVACSCNHCCNEKATMCSVRIVAVHVTFKHTTILSAAQKCLYGEFLSPEEQRT